MKKYKLINKKTNQEHLCDKITIDGFNYYVSDEEIFIGNWYFLPRTNSLYQCNEDPTELNLERKVGIKKVIATNNSSIDIPKVVDNVKVVSFCYDKFGYTCSESLSMTHNRIQFKDAYVAGYNKSQETHPNSDEDMIEFYRWLNKYGWQDYDDIKKGMFVNRFGVQKQDKELIQIWKEQKPETLYYE